MKKHFTFLCLICTCIVFSQSKIEESKKELNEAEAASKTTARKTKSSSEGGEINHFTEQVLEYTIGGLLYVTIGSYKNEYHLGHNITPYPLYNGESGNYEGYDTIKKIRFRFDVEDRFLYSNPDLTANHLKLKVRPFQYFYVSGDYHQLWEYNKLGNRTDALSLFYMNLCYDRLRFERFNFGWSLGAVYVGNEMHQFRPAFGLTAAWFPGKHLSFEAEAKFASISSKPVNTFEITGKYHLKRYFVSLGYENLKIATPKYNFIAIGGGIYF